MAPVGAECFKERKPSKQAIAPDRAQVAQSAGDISFVAGRIWKLELSKTRF